MAKKVNVRMKSLPSQVAVAWDDAQSDDPQDAFLMASETPDSHADGEWRKVGIYKLVETVEVRQTTETKRRKVKS